MSCIVGIVAKNRVYIGADSMSSNDSCQVPRQDQKLFRVSGKKDAIIGFTGSFRLGQIIQYSKGLIDPRARCDHKYVVTKFIPKMLEIFDKNCFIQKDESGAMTGDPFLLAFKGKLFQIESDFQVAESLYGYDSVGSGDEYALGSLFSTEKLGLDPIERIHLALASASRFGVGVGAPFHILCTETNKEIVFEN